MEWEKVTKALSRELDAKKARQADELPTLVRVIISPVDDEHTQPEKHIHCDTVKIAEFTAFPSTTLYELAVQLAVTDARLCNARALSFASTYIAGNRRPQQRRLGMVGLFTEPDAALREMERSQTLEQAGFRVGDLVEVAAMYSAAVEKRLVAPRRRRARGGRKVREKRMNMLRRRR